MAWRQHHPGWSKQRFRLGFLEVHFTLEMGFIYILDEFRLAFLLSFLHKYGNTEGGINVGSLGVACNPKNESEEGRVLCRSPRRSICAFVLTAVCLSFS